MLYRMRELRLQKGWSQYDLARETGLSQALISKVESGRGEGRVSTLQKIATVLETTLDELTKKADEDE